GDLLLGGAHERAVSDDVLAPDDQPLDAVRRGEHKPGEQILGTAELEAVGPPDRQVGTAAGLDGAEVVTAEHRGAASCAEAERLPWGQGGRAAATAGDEQRLLDVEEQVAALVRGRAVDADPDPYARVEQCPNRRDAGAEA